MIEKELFRFELIKNVFNKKNQTEFIKTAEKKELIQKHIKNFF